MYSALNSRLLLPPSTIGDPGTVGPIERMSKPRTLYSPPRNRRSKIGSAGVQTSAGGTTTQDELPTGAMYSAWARNPTEVRDVCLKNMMPSTRGL